MEMKNEIILMAKLNELDFIEYSMKGNKNNSKQIFSIEINENCLVFIEYQVIY
jgi:hypothetical protein